MALPGAGGLCDGIPLYFSYQRKYGGDSETILFDGNGDFSSRVCGRNDPLPDDRGKAERVFQYTGGILFYGGYITRRLVLFYYLLSERRKQTG